MRTKEECIIDDNLSSSRKKLSHKLGLGSMGEEGMVK